MADQTHDLFSAVFGTDSGSDDDDDDDVDDWSSVCHDAKKEFYEWHSSEAVAGLWHCISFLKPQEEQSLVDAIEAEGWFTQPLHNQAMRFGELPGWALTLSSRISSICAFKREQTPEGLVCQKSSRDAPLADDILYREPLFDQMIVNSYQPGEGIAPHVDLARFQDGIAVVSLLSCCVMTFRRCEDASQKMDVLLSPGDLILLSDDARYKWTHEINRKNEQEHLLRRVQSETIRQQYVFNHEYKIAVGTWNVGGLLPPDDLDLEGWIDTSEPADIYVLEFQEVVPLTTGNVLCVEDEAPIAIWAELIRDTLNNKMKFCKEPPKSYSAPPSPWHEDDIIS